MKYTYYPGCTAGTTSVEFGRSTEVVCEALDIELLELGDWNCCGASSAHSLNHDLSLSLPGRNVALAQEAGLDVIIPCPACYQNCLSADNAFRQDEEWQLIAVSLDGDISWHITRPWSERLSDLRIGAPGVIYGIRQNANGLNEVVRLAAQ